MDNQKKKNEHIKELLDNTRYPKDIGRIYLIVLLISISLIVFLTVISTILVVEYNYPEFLLKDRIQSFYFYKIIPGTFRYLMFPAAVFTLNTIFVSYFRDWYLIFLFFELVILFLLKSKINSNDLFNYSESTFYIGLVILFVFGLFLYFKNDSLFKHNRETRDKSQTIIYEIILPKHKIANLFTFIFNVLSIYFGSLEIPVMGIRFYVLCLSSWSLAVLLLWNECFRAEMFLGVCLLSLGFKYESLYVNYHTNVAFKKNFDANARYWIIRLSKSNNIIKRYYCTQVIRGVVNKIGSLTLVNPTRRTVVVLGGGFIFCGVLATGVFAYKVNVEGRTAMEKIASDEKTTMEKIASDEKTTMEKIASDEKTTMEKIASDERIKIKKIDADHDIKVKQIENAKKAGWNIRLPWNKGD